MDLTKTIEHLVLEGILFQETKPFLEQYGGHLIFESVGKGDYQLTLSTSTSETKERILVKGMPTEVISKYFLYRLHGAMAKLLGEVHPL